jgi:hypothetical protein
MIKVLLLQVVGQCAGRTRFESIAIFASVHKSLAVLMGFDGKWMV